MAKARITKRLVDSLKAEGKEDYVFDTDLMGFAVRVRPSGGKSYIVQYKAGSGRGAPTRRVTIGAVGKMAPDEARKQAERILGQVAQGKDPAQEKKDHRDSATVAEVAETYLAQHVKAKRKPRTYSTYVCDLGKLTDKYGKRRIIDLTTPDVARLHLELKDTPYAANRTLANTRAMYNWAARQKIVPKGFNPAEGIEKYPEQLRATYLKTEELERLGAAIREGETVGIPWEPDPNKKIKHAPKPENRIPIKFGPHVAGALRLLIFTGARIGEIMHLEWSHVDLERGLLLLPDSKTGSKTIYLSAGAAAVIDSMPRIGKYVIAGDSAGTENEKPRFDLKRPWATVKKRAGLNGVRIHDLRHTNASFGIGAGLGLPVVGKLLGHSQPKTTARYAHLETDVAKRAAETIGERLLSAMEGRTTAKASEPVKPSRPRAVAARRRRT
jgi:integrase